MFLEHWRILLQCRLVAEIYLKQIVLVDLAVVFDLETVSSVVAIIQLVIVDSQSVMSFD